MYKIVFDIAEAKVKDYANGEKSALTFEVVADPLSNINVFCENIPIKSSIVRGPWLKELEKC